MRILVLFCSITFICAFGYSQQTLDGSLSHDGELRTYKLYIPANYTGETAVPLVFNFHGYTSNAGDQMWYADFRSIADTAGFLVVHPQGTLFGINTHWNVGGWTVGSTVDDVDFTETLLESLAMEYNINLDRVYSTGMSNGGFMSFLLACQLSDKIAAIASVTGSMTPETYDPCNPQHPIPVMQIHGTIDGVVPYNGAAWTKSVQQTLQFWIDYNNCNPSPSQVSLPNTNILDGSTVEHFVYGGGDNGSTTEHFKVTGGGHTWPGTILSAPGTNQDFNASEEIWRFFSRYDINGLISTTNTAEAVNKLNINLYPNPTNSHITVESDFTKEIDYELLTQTGQQVLKGTIKSRKEQIDISNLTPNVYLLKIGEQSFKILKTE